MRIIVMLLLASAPIALNAATQPTRDQIFNSAVYSRPAISASGKWIASSGARDGKLRLYPMDGGTPTETGTPADFQGRWYRWAKGAGDALIIYGGINGRDVFYRLDAESGKLVRVTGDEHRPSMSFGMPTNRYAFTYDRLQKGDSYQDLAPDGTLVDASKASAHLPGYLAAEGRYLRIAPGPKGFDFLAGADAARRGTVNVLHEDMRMAGGLMSLSNDGSAWILSSQDQDTMGLLSLDTASGARKAVFSAPVDIHAVSLDPATMTPDFVEYETTAPARALLNQRVAADLKLLDSKGNGFATILDRSPNDRYWVVGYLHRDGTPRMASFDRTSKKILPLPAAAYTYLDSPDWRVRPFSITRPDGVNVSGHVTLPRAGMCEKRSCPAVLMVHGGPGIRDKAAFNLDRFWMSSRGVAVITVNYRGSRGFGKKFMQMDQRQWAGAIPQDVNAALAHAIKSFPIDGKRVAAVGTSFGGFMALHLAGTGTPVRCVVVDSASTDIVKFADRLFAKYGEGSDILQRVGDTRVAADKAAMIAMSPSAMIDKLKAIPILHLHGGRDDITVQEDSQQFIDDMLAANPRYTFVGMAQAGHGLYPHRSQYYALAENFLGKCLDVPMQEITKAEAASMMDFEFKGGAVDHGAAPKTP